MYQSVTSPALIRRYYLATGAFLLFDYLAGINVRVAFLEPWPGWRAAYYLFCFGCLGLMAWRPALTTAVSTVESLLTLSALILGMGVRITAPALDALESGSTFVSIEEVVNFLICGGVAWLGWFRGSQALQRSLRP